MDLTDLRQAALKLLEGSSENIDSLRRQSPQELIHELRVHQAELEMQNEELRRSQLELEAQRDKFANLFDFAPVGYVMLDGKHRIVEANLTIAKLLGVARGALAGQLLSQYVIPEDAAQLSRHLRDIVTASKSVCELTFQTADHELVRARLDSVTVIDDGRSVAITDLRENAELLRAKRSSDERLRVICHALPIPIAYIDAAQLYQFNNAAHEELFNLPCERIQGRAVKDVLGHAAYERMGGFIERALAGQSVSCTLELPHAQFGTRSFQLHYAPYRDESNRVVGYYELMFDISDTRRIEEESKRRAELRERLRELSYRQRSVFDLLMDGHSNKTITHRLDVSMRTVERERQTVLRLLGVASINEMLVSFAGLSKPEELA